MPDPMRFQRTPLRQSDGKDEGGSSFTDPVFDDDYYGRDQAGGRGRTIGLVVGVVFGAVIAGTAAWFVFGPGGGVNRGATPLIVAEPEPYKVRPEDPGGMQVENQDKLVYERLGSTAPEAGVENILPPPERPRAPQPASPEAQTPEVNAADSGPDESQSASPPAVAETEPVPAPESESQPVPAQPAAEPTAPVQVETAPASQPAPVQTQEPSAQSLESMVAALSGDYLIQIAALRSEEAALGEWTRVQTRLPELLGAFEPLVVRADLGERGIFYRLRAGPLENRTAADTLCQALAAEDVGCLVVRNE